MTFPFEVPYGEVAAHPDAFIDAVFSSLASDFLLLPKGVGFIEYSVFETGYEALKKATSGFRILTPEAILPTATAVPISLVVLRAMLGFTPPEWAHVTSEATGTPITQGFIRSLDRRIRMQPTASLFVSPEKAARIAALVETATRLLQDGAPAPQPDKLHRLEKVDTSHGGPWLPTLADTGLSYAMLLYERFLGRPFAGHRDSVSELIGDNLEGAIEELLVKAGISFRKTRRAERVPGFDQSPDFIIPSIENPRVVIEAKVTEDDGTARDKVTRVQHLASISEGGQLPGQRKFELIACIAGRGFKVRREDMRKLLEAARGKVFTLQNLGSLIDCTSLKEYRTRLPEHT